MKPSLDDIDLRILLMLQADPRMPVSKVARRVGLTDNAVRYRLRRMQQAGVIRGFALVLDPQLLGRPQLALLCVRLADPADYVQLMEEHPEVVGGYLCEGPYSACLFVCLEAGDDFDRVTEEVRKRPGVLEAMVMRVVEGHGGAPMPLMHAPFGLTGPTPGKPGKAPPTAEP